MRPFKHTTHTSAFFFLPILWLVGKSRIAKAIIIVSVFALAGCFQYYYKTNTKSRVEAAFIQQLQAANKYFIVHFRDSAVALTHVSASSEKIEGDMVSLMPEHGKYLNPDKLTTTSQTTVFSPKKTHYRVKAKDRMFTLMEVHLYADEDIQKDRAQLSLPLSSLKRIDVYELDRQATSANHVLSIVGGALVVGTAAVLIAFAIACNCPQVYVANNGDYQFVSGVYSGAVYSSLERTDYLPLVPLNTCENACDLKVKNVKDEEQFINGIQLLQVSHTPGTKILVDRHGKVFSYRESTAPVSAIINKKTNVTHQIAAVDHDAYSFDSEKDKNGLSSVEFTFSKPPGIKKAKLLVHAGNSSWSGYLYHSFAALFGSSYEKWKSEKDKSDPKEMEKWQTDQGLPLMVYIEKNGKWEFVDYFAHTGNTASRDMIMELDVADIKSSEVKIKLETVYQFWNLDFVAIDFSDNDRLQSHVLNPVKAIRTDGRDQTENLSFVDKNYTYLKPEEEITLKFDRASSNHEDVNSYFLLSTGYYHSIKKYEGAAKISTLMQFKNKNAFDDYSRDKFLEIQKTLDSYAVKNRK